MAQEQSALSELLAALRTSEALDLVREAVRLVYQELVEAEASAAIGAGMYERSETRSNERNGYRPKTISTKAGDIELGIPKLRKGSFFLHLGATIGRRTGSAFPRPQFNDSALLDASLNVGPTTGVR